MDTNILIYAHRRESDANEAAAAFMRTLAEGDVVWAIPWPCCYEFLSVATNPRIWRDDASTPEQAWRQLAAWTASPSNRLIGETSGFVELLGTVRAKTPGGWRGHSRRPYCGSLCRSRSRGAPHAGSGFLAVPGTAHPQSNRRRIEFRICRNGPALCYHRSNKVTTPCSASSGPS